VNQPAFVTLATPPSCHLAALPHRLSNISFSQFSSNPCVIQHKSFIKKLVFHFYKSFAVGHIARSAANPTKVTSNARRLRPGGNSAEHCRAAKVCKSKTKRTQRSRKKIEAALHAIYFVFSKVKAAFKGIRRAQTKCKSAGQP